MVNHDRTNSDIHANHGQCLMCLCYFLPYFLFFVSVMSHFTFVCSPPPFYYLIYLPGLLSFVFFLDLLPPPLRSRESDIHLWMLGNASSCSSECVCTNRYTYAAAACAYVYHPVQKDCVPTEHMMCPTSICHTHSQWSSGMLVDRVQFAVTDVCTCVRGLWILDMDSVYFAWWWEGSLYLCLSLSPCLFFLI
jgi:hypothetical protein